MSLSSLAVILALIPPLQRRGHGFAHSLVIHPIPLGTYEAIFKEKTLPLNSVFQIDAIMVYNEFFLNLEFYYI